MKKFAIGIVVGALLMYSGQIFADTVSRIGSKVGGEATVYLNDKQLSDAIIVDNKSYAPVRDIAEAFGADVQFNSGISGGKAVINLKSYVQSSDGSVIPPEHMAVMLEQKKEELLKEKADLENAISKIESERIPYEKEKLDNATTEYLKDYQGKVVAEYEKLLEEKKQELAELEARVAEIDEQIADLKSAE